MWIERQGKKVKFINELDKLVGQVLIIRGARQVGKTSFILNALNSLPDSPRLMVNFLYPGSFRLEGVDYLGRDFFGRSPGGEEFLKNIERHFGRLDRLEKPALIFIDEADRFPEALESIQTLSQFSRHVKFILTGSNLENIPVKNAATGRKKYFDLYPITFFDFLSAGGHDKHLDYCRSLSLKESHHSEFHHNQLNDLLEVYIRLGGMPRIIDAYLDTERASTPLAEIARDLAYSIEENVKAVLGEKSKLYEYEDVLRRLAALSLNTLKFSRLQVRHAGQSEAKKLVFKTVGARVAHKIRLWEAERDLSKYLIFDSGLVNYLLNGSELLKTAIVPQYRAVMLETFVGNEIVNRLTDREDLYYWKSGNKAEIEFMLRSPLMAGIDVKTQAGNIRSLNSFALMENQASCIIKASNQPLDLNRKHLAGLPNYPGKKELPFITLPHYLASRIPELLNDF